MNTYAKLAITAIVVVAVGAAGLALLGPGMSGLGGRVGPSPSVPLSPPPTSSLVGTWRTGPSTCAQQNAALANAGFMAEQLRLGGWEAATCLGMTHGSVHTVQFGPGSQIVQLADGRIGWQGTYDVVDATTMRARDQGWTITYYYTIDGDTLIVDMTQIDAPAGTPEANVWADRIAQTVIYESLPFTRQTSIATSAPSAPAPTPIAFTSDVYGYRVTLPAGWSAIPARTQWDGTGAPPYDDPSVDGFASGPSLTVFGFAGTTPLALNAYADDVVARTAQFHGDTCPDPPTSVDSIRVAGVSAKFIAFDCGILINIVVFVDHGTGYEFVMRDMAIDAATDAADRSVFDAILASITLAK